MRVISMIALAITMCAGHGFGQVVINEVMPQTGSGGVYASEWVELYNAGLGAVDIAGWRLVDDPYTYTFPDLNGGIVIDPGSYVVIWGRLQTGGYAQGDDGREAAGNWNFYIGGLSGSNGTLHGLIWLGNIGDDLLLADTNGTAVDWLSYRGTTSPAPVVDPVVTTIDPDVDESVARCQDATGSYLRLCDYSQTSPGSLNYCPQVTPTPLPTATPLPACCDTVTHHFRPGWNSFSYPGVPEFGLRAVDLAAAMENQGITAWYLARWTGTGWWIRGFDVPIPIPADLEISPAEGLFLLILAPHDFTYTHCHP